MGRARTGAALVTALLLGLLLPPPVEATDQEAVRPDGIRTPAVHPSTLRVFVSSAGDQGNRNSGTPAVSSDGTSVAFDSYASNLVPGDTNGNQDVFVHNLVTGRTERVSVSSEGTQSNAPSSNPSISADGRYVAFQSYASNVVPGDTAGVQDVFVRDLSTGLTTMVSVACPVTAVT